MRFFLRGFKYDLRLWVFNFLRVVTYFSSIFLFFLFLLFLAGNLQRLEESSRLFLLDSQRVTSVVCLVFGGATLLMGSRFFSFPFSKQPGIRSNYIFIWVIVLTAFVCLMMLTAIRAFIV